MIETSIATNDLTLAFPVLNTPEEQGRAIEAIIQYHRVPSDLIVSVRKLFKVCTCRQKQNGDQNLLFPPFLSTTAANNLRPAVLHLTDLDNWSRIANTMRTHLAVMVRLVLDSACLPEKEAIPIYMETQTERMQAKSIDRRIIGMVMILYRYFTFRVLDRERLAEAAPSEYPRLVLKNLRQQLQMIDDSLLQAVANVDGMDYFAETLLAIKYTGQPAIIIEESDVMAEVSTDHISAEVSLSPAVSELAVATASTSSVIDSTEVPLPVETAKPDNAELPVGTAELASELESTIRTWVAASLSEPSVYSYTAPAQNGTQSAKPSQTDHNNDVGSPAPVALDDAVENRVDATRQGTTVESKSPLRDTNGSLSNRMRKKLRQNPGNGMTKRRNTGWQQADGKKRETAKREDASISVKRNTPDTTTAQSTERYDSIATLQDMATLFRSEHSADIPLCLYYLFDRQFIRPKEALRMIEAAGISFTVHRSRKSGQLYLEYEGKRIDENDCDNEETADDALPATASYRMNIQSPVPWHDIYNIVLAEGDYRALDLYLAEKYPICINHAWLAKWSPIMRERRSGSQAETIGNGRHEV